MTSVGVRSEALTAAAVRLAAAADELRDQAGALAGALAGCAPPLGRPGLLAPWWRVQAHGQHTVGPAGLWGDALALDALSVRLRAAARAYVEVEASVSALLAGVSRGADAAARHGWLVDGTAAPLLREVAPRWSPVPPRGPADLVALGEGLDGARVRVVEIDDGAGGSAWVVAIPGTQEWSPLAGANPFDVTTDVRAVTGEATVAAAGVALALEHARARAGRLAPAAPQDPVLLVGHSQGGILAAALASDATFTARHRVTHLVTSGAPVGALPVPEATRVLSVEHAEDPVPALDLTPNPARGSWTTLRVGAGPPVDTGRHRLQTYVGTARAAQDAPRGTVPGLAGWTATAGAFLHRPVRSVTEVVIQRPPATPAPTGRIGPRDPLHGARVGPGR